MASSPRARDGQACGQRWGGWLRPGSNRPACRATSGMYRPEFVIVSFIADDIGRTEWARQVGSKPYFVIDGQGNLEFHLQALPDAARRDLYFPNHGHMTPAGNALVAKEIARVLR